MAGTLRLTRLRFFAGSKSESPPLEIEPSTVVVLIGPNNSGKSLALREIEMWSTSRDQERKIIDTISVDFPVDIDTAAKLLAPFTLESSVDRVQVNGEVSLDRNFILHHPALRQGQQVRSDRSFANEIQLSMERNLEGNLSSYLTSWNTIRLDGRTRFELTDPRQGGDLLGPPATHLHALAQEDEARARVRAMTADAFGLYFVLDFLNPGWVRIRMSPRPPIDSEEELSLSSRAQAFHRQATPIEELSDGVKAFTGLVAAVQTLPHRILLIDEPEAFLHPPLARKLGAALATIARDRNASLVIGTHSADILLGCLESVSDTSVIRLDFDLRTGVATAKQLPATVLSAMAQDPLLRSSDVLRALFHRAAVVCESESDRVVYDEINRRLLEEGRGLPETLVLNTYGKDSVHSLVGPLRLIGVPAAAIVDLDVLRAGGAWPALLRACGVPETDRPRIEAERSFLLQAFQVMPPQSDSGDILKRHGTSALGPGDRERAEAFLAQLTHYGLFLVPGGELESWLPNVGAAGHGPAWVKSLFARIGASSDDSNYVRPGSDDIWCFIDGISTWVSDPVRKGMT